MRAPLRSLLLAVAAPVAGAGCNGGAPTVLVERFEACRDPRGRELMEHARSRLTQGRAEEALAFLEQALELCPETVTLHLLYLDTAERTGQGPRAASFYRRDLGIPEESPVGPYVRARLEEDPARRLDLLEESLEREPRFYFGWLSRGRVLRGLGRQEEAIQALERAVAIHPFLAAADLELAELKEEAGSPILASVHYRRYLAAHPQDRVARKNLARLLLGSPGEDLEEAGRLLERLLEEDPYDENLHLMRGALRWRLGDLEGARDVYRDVLAAHPTHGRALLNLGNLYLGPLGDPGRARACYLHFLGAGSLEDAADHLDWLFTIPYRLRSIEAELGPFEGPLPPASEL